MPDSKMVKIVSEDAASEESLRLIKELTVELGNLYEDDGGANSFDPHKSGDRRSAFVVARLDGRAIG